MRRITLGPESLSKAEKTILHADGTAMALTKRTAPVWPCEPLRALFQERQPAPGSPFEARSDHVSGICRGRKKKQSAMVLSRDTFVFHVDKSISEKRTQWPRPLGSPSEMCGRVIRHSAAQVGTVAIPENSENHSSHSPADMTDHIHVMRPFGHFLFTVSAEHWIVLDGDCRCQPDGAAQIRRVPFRAKLYPRKWSHCSV